MARLAQRLLESNSHSPGVAKKFQMNVRVVCERDMLQCAGFLTERLRPAVAWITFSHAGIAAQSVHPRFQRYMPTPLSIAVLLTLVAGLWPCAVPHR